MARHRQLGKRCATCGAPIPREIERESMFCQTHLDDFNAKLAAIQRAEDGAALLSGIFKRSQEAGR